MRYKGHGKPTDWNTGVSAEQTALLIDHFVDERLRSRRAGAQRNASVQCRYDGLQPRFLLDIDSKQGFADRDRVANLLVRFYPSMRRYGFPCHRPACSSALHGPAYLVAIDSREKACGRGLYLVLMGRLMQPLRTLKPCQVTALCRDHAA